MTPTLLVDKVRQAGWDPDEVLWIFPSETAASFWRKTFSLPCYGLVEYAQKCTGIRLASEEELEMAFQEALAQVGYKGENPIGTGLIFASDCDEIALYTHESIPSYWQKVAADKEIQKIFQLLEPESPLLREVQRIYPVNPKQVGQFYQQLSSIYTHFEKNLETRCIGYRAKILQEYHRLPKPEKQVWVDFWRLRPLEKRIFENSQAILILPYGEFLPADLKSHLPPFALTIGPRPLPIQYSQTSFTSPIQLYDAFLSRVSHTQPHKAIFLSQNYLDYEYISSKTSLPLYTQIPKPFYKEPSAFLFQVLLEYSRFGTLSPATEKILPPPAKLWAEKLKTEGLSWENLFPLLNQIPNVPKKVLQLIAHHHAMGGSPNRPELWYALLNLPLDKVPSSEIDQAAILMLNLSECIGLYADSLHIPIYEEDLLLSWRHQSFIPTGLRPLTPTQAYQENLLFYWRLLTTAPQIHFYILQTRNLSTPTLNLLEYASELGFWPAAVHSSPPAPTLRHPLPQLNTLVEGQECPLPPKKKYSISDIVTYLRCPRQHAWNQYFQREFPTLPEWKSEPFSKDLQGTLLHKVIEEIFITFPEGKLQEIRKTINQTFPTLFKKAWDTFRQENTSKWTLSPYEIYFYEKALMTPIHTALQRFYDFLENYVNILSYEKADVEFSLPEKPLQDIRGRLYGRGDLRLHAQGYTFLIDIKTVKSLKPDPSSLQDLWSLHNPHNSGKNLQLILYAALSPWPSEAYLWSPFVTPPIHYSQEQLQFLWENFALELEKILNDLDNASNVALLSPVPQKTKRTPPCIYCSYTVLCGVS